MKILLCGLGILASCACSSSPAISATHAGSGGSAGQSASGGAAGAAGATAGCPDGSHANGSGCQSTLTLTQSAQTLPAKIDHHTTLVIETSSGPFVYVFGGTDSWTAMMSEIRRAPIHDDGSLGAFETIGNLPEPRAGHTTLQIDDWIIVSAGVSGAMKPSSLLSSTLIAKLAPDGTLGPWQTGPDFPTAVMHHTCNAMDRHIYCLGGRIDGNYTSAMSVRADLADDGTLGAWQDATPLPESRGFMAAFVHDGSLYMAGGLHRDAPATDFDRLSDVERAPIAADGSLGPWQPAGKLPTARTQGAVGVFLDRVYFAGGMDGNDMLLSDVLSAGFSADHALGDFEEEAQLSAPRYHVHQIPTYRHFMYVVGGRDSNEQSTNVVDVGTFE